MLYAFFWVIPRRGITQKKAYNKAYFCLSMATLNDFVFLAATCMLATTQREPIVVFPLPQGLYERVTVLGYT